MLTYVLLVKMQRNRDARRRIRKFASEAGDKLSLQKRLFPNHDTDETLMIIFCCTMSS
ncbi:hypothetical protein MESS2_440068 [Mesorhizobium metallidurans STM 2683]|uniref:Uncharacterized protein n=1 Tax=Mesorhizobium metallidurans STM 2683 TaxID=1297569 RepID=M5ESI0_9HYPH|nr:hypothetical protein MESS2_440068 [Mesorhizobium metallidurans STM 2683]